MSPHLPREVIAAIETAVEVNNGVLESAYIHSLAKIYKTSPQAVVWNMKRYNKVKAGCDDRQKTGRHAAMDKDKASEFVRELLAEKRDMRQAVIAEKLSERFGVTVSATWASRLMKNYGIPQKTRRPPGIKKVRVPMAPGEQSDGSLAQQYPLPSPGQYPSFREDLHQALTAGQPHPHPPVLDSGYPAAIAPPPPPPPHPNPPVIDGWHQVVIAPSPPPPPPAKPDKQVKTGRPPHLKTSYPAGHTPRFEGFSIFKLPGVPRHTFVHEIEIQNPSTPTTPGTPSPRAFEVSNQNSVSRTTPDISTNWKVLKVVELP
jgi:transposase